MWWPSFCAVLVDLWRFMIGQSTVPATSSLTPPATRTPRTSQLEDQRQPHPAPVQLYTNVRYLNDHPTTQIVRGFLQEQIGVDKKTTDLTMPEWIIYMHSVAGRPLPYTELLSVSAGSWHQTLRGLRNVHISLEPKTQTIIEWLDKTATGHLGLVQKVSPSDTITFQELGATLPGALTEWTLTESEWRELRPVFISVT